MTNEIYSLQNKIIEDLIIKTDKAKFDLVLSTFKKTFGFELEKEIYKDINIVIQYHHSILDKVEVMTYNSVPFLK